MAEVGRTILSCQKCRVAGKSFKVPHDDDGLAKITAHLRTEHKEK